MPPQLREIGFHVQNHATQWHGFQHEIQFQEIVVAWIQPTCSSNGVDQERSLRKFLIRHRGMKFCINCTSLECFASSLCSSIMVPKCTQTERNARKHELRFQLCGSRASVSRNSDETLWHELLH